MARVYEDFVCPPQQLAQALLSEHNWFSGVPDSDLAGVIDALPNWHFASRENHAVAMAFGAALGGKRPSVLMQNSGLGLTLDCLAGTFLLYQVPLLLVISNRGTLEWEEPQHQLWGEKTCEILDGFSIPWFVFGDSGQAAVADATERSRTDNSVTALILERGNLLDSTQRGN